MDRILDQIQLPKDLYEGHIRRIFGIFYSENTKNDSAVRQCLLNKMKPFYPEIVLKTLSQEALVPLCGEIRQQMLLRLSMTGGHVGFNLAVIEATVALHYVFDSPADKIIFDVSHQCYTHKLLIGRKDAYTDSEKFSSVSGFTNPEESEHDVFSIGYTSTAISLTCGVAKGRDVNGESYNVVAVVGDGQ